MISTPMHVVCFSSTKYMFPSVFTIASIHPFTCLAFEFYYKYLKFPPQNKFLKSELLEHEIKAVGSLTPPGSGFAPEDCTFQLPISSCLCS